MTSHKTLYEEFCRTHSVPIHLQPWWLDAVCVKGTWDVCLSVDPQGQVLGAMPYYLTRRWGLPLILQPPLSTYGGPWLCYPNHIGSKPSHRIHFEKKVYTALIQQLPRVAFFRQNFRPEVQNWLPFYWNKYRQTTRYTYILDKEAVQQADKLLQSSTRKKINQSASRYQVSVSDDFDAYFRLLQQSYTRRNLRLPMSHDALKNLYQSLGRHQNGTLLMAHSNTTGDPVAAYLLVHDATRAGLLSSGEKIGPEMAHLNYRMMWECILFCAQNKLELDFEGSMDIGMEHLLRAFGAKPTPYFQVWKSGNALLEAVLHWR